MEMSYILFFHTKLWKSSTFYAYGMYQLGQAMPEAAVFTCGQWWLYNSPHLDALKRPEDPKTLTQGIFLNRNLNDFSHPSDMPTTVQNVGKASLGRKPAAGGGKKKKNVGKPKSVTARKELSQSSKNLNSESTATMLDLPQRAAACEGFWNKAELRLSTVLGKVSDPVSIWPSQSLQQWPHTSFSPRSNLRPCPQAWAGAHMLAWNLICLGHGTS